MKLGLGMTGIFPILSSFLSHWFTLYLPFSSFGHSLVSSHALARCEGEMRGSETKEGALFSFPLVLCLTCVLHYFLLRKDWGAFVSVSLPVIWMTAVSLAHFRLQRLINTAFLNTRMRNSLSLLSVHSFIFNWSHCIVSERQIGCVHFSYY